MSFKIVNPNENGNVTFFNEVMIITCRTPSPSPVRAPMLRAQSASPIRAPRSPGPQQQFRPSTPRSPVPGHHGAIPRAPSLPAKLPPGSTRPRFTRPLGQQPMTEGEPVTLECIFESYPPAQVTWSRHGQIIQDGNRYVFFANILFCAVFIT